MAITYDTSASTVSSGSGTKTLSITPSAGATLLVVAINSQSTPSSTPTFNGVTMTQVDTVRNSNLRTYVLLNPSIGTYNVSVTMPSGVTQILAATYKDVNQPGTPNSTGGSEGASNSVTLSTTTTVDNTMLIYVGANNNYLVDVTSSTTNSVRRVVRSDSPFETVAIFDLLVAQTPAGSKSVNLTSSGAFVFGSIFSVVQGAVASGNSNFFALL